jgi:hypothetical protein
MPVIRFSHIHNETHKKPEQDDSISGNSSRSQGIVNIGASKQNNDTDQEFVPEFEKRSLLCIIRYELKPSQMVSGPQPQSK